MNVKLVFINSLISEYLPAYNTVKTKQWGWEK